MKKRNVLIVDDHDDIRTLIKTTLGDVMYEVGLASNGQEALQYLESHDYPELIILDMAMPIMDGIQVLEKLKSDPDTAWIEVIILSAQLSSRQQKELAEKGARAVLDKPFGPLELLTLLDEIFEKNPKS